jgi:hypothetical protein
MQERCGATTTAKCSQEMQSDNLRNHVTVNEQRMEWDMLQLLIAR